jgi:hypothetical protein
MSFADNAKAIAGCASVALTGGAASCTTGSLPAGSHSIVATYSGDTSSNPSSSSALGQSVQATAVSAAAVSSLVIHYYQAILRRNPDPSGQAYWEGEAARVQSLGASVNEAFYTMGMAFFSSSEYASYGRDDTGFVTDLYNAFFNRAPDAGGLAGWTSQLASGMPREALLLNFLFSPEFASYMQSTLGASTARAEVNMVMDFYRGVLGRLPDSGGFTNWVQQLRTAQCQNIGAINAQVTNISIQFLNSPEYAGRARNNTYFMTDLYDAFMRRGPDLGGLQWWVGQLNAGTSRETARQSFASSPEFAARVNAVAAQGCSP